MKVTFLGGVKTVTGSSTLLESNSKKFLVDCGLFQGGQALEERNRDTRAHSPGELSFILLTHAHIDHSGLIPKLAREGFRGRVICTKATFDLCEIMLRDSGHIQETESEWRTRKHQRSGRKALPPLYTVKDAEESLRSFETVRYGEILPLSEGIRVCFQDAGHILGSAIIEMWVKENGRERKMVFSGDLGSSGQPIIRDPSRIEDGDVLFIESTYGNRLHKSRQETVDELIGIIRQAVRDQSKVLIPAFAVGRTQDILYTIGELMRKGLIPSIPVYVDSPLAISATEIFTRNPDDYDLETLDLLSGGKNPLEFPEIIFTQATEASKTINEDEGTAIIVAASGMCESGRIKHHLKHHLWREKSHIVIIGYQPEGTMGRRLIDGAKAVRLFGEEIAVKAHIHTLGGFSAHADQKGLLEWIGSFKNPGLEVFVVHGEEKVSNDLRDAIREHFHFKTTVPEWRETRLLFGAKEREPLENAVRERAIPQEEITFLFKDLDRNYRRLRRKLKDSRWDGAGIRAAHYREQLEELNARLKKLESEM